MLRAIGQAYRGAYSGIRRPVWLLTLTSLVNRSGTMVLPFLVLYLTKRRAFTTPEAGQAISLYGIGALAGAYLGGYLADRIAPRRIMIASLLATAGAFLVLQRLESRPAIYAMMLVLSIVGESFRPANSAAIAAASPPAERVRSIALLRLAINTGMTAGSALGGFLAHYSYAWLFWVDAGTSAAAALLLWLAFRKEPAVVPREAANLGLKLPAERTPWRDLPFLALMGLLFLLALVMFQTIGTFPLTLDRVQGLASTQIGLVLMVNTLLIVAFEMVIVHSLHGADPLKVMGVGSFLFCAGFALLPLGHGFAFVTLTVLVWTLGEMLSMPMLGGIVANRAGERNRGGYMGLYNLALAGAFVLAPIVGTWVYDRYGSAALWYACLPVGLLLAVGLFALSPAFAHDVPRPEPRPAYHDAPT
ncbi:MAG TPA: MFS transporter [Thermoanaerobaculia bacterium]